jgi:DNA-binding MarR family transcriptional regulator
MRPVPFATTLHVRDTCLCFHTQRAARTLARRFDAALKPAGLTNNQFSLMMGLNRPSPATMADLTALLAMDRTTLTAALKLLQAKRWVKVSADVEDRRQKRIGLTALGLRRLARAVPLWEEEHRALERAIGAPERLRRDLRMIG